MVNLSLQCCNIDLISKFNIFKYKLLLRMQTILIFFNLKTKESEFLQNFLVMAKVLYFWLKQKVIIFYFKKDLVKDARNSLIITVGITLARKNWGIFLIYFKNILYKGSKYMIDFCIRKHVNNGICLSFVNLNYLLGLNINKYYKSNLQVHILVKFNSSTIASNFYEKIFF